MINPKKHDTSISDKSHLAGYSCNWVAQQGRKPFEPASNRREILSGPGLFTDSPTYLSKFTFDHLFQELSTVYRIPQSTEYRVPLADSVIGALKMTEQYLNNNAKAAFFTQRDWSAGSAIWTILLIWAILFKSNQDSCFYQRILQLFTTHGSTIRLFPCCENVAVKVRQNG